MLTTITYISSRVTNKYEIQNQTSETSHLLTRREGGFRHKNGMQRENVLMTAYCNYEVVCTRTEI